MSEKLYPDGDFIFVAGGGAYHDERGKTHWPALLRLEMDAHTAFRIMETMLRQLREGFPVIELDFSGSIQRQDDEGRALNIDGSAKESEADDER